MNDRLLGHMADADLVKSIRIEQAEIGDDQFRIEKVVDHLNVNKARACVAVGSLDVEFREISQNRLNDPVKQPIDMNTNVRRRT